MPTYTELLKRDPATGTCRLFLRISGVCYSLEHITPAPEHIRGWRLRKADGTVYDVGRDEHGLSCTCPDFAFRRDGLEPEGCKHVKALTTVGLLEES